VDEIILERIVGRRAGLRAIALEARPPCLGTPFSSHSKALFTLLLWFRSVFSANPMGAWCSLARSARTALNRAGTTSSGLSSALAICRNDVVQWRWVCSGSSSAASIIAIA
jgi:hypothetical protein